MLELKMIHPLFGAEVAGFKANQEIDAATAAELRKAIADHGVLLLRGQSLTDAELEQFAAHFGAIYKRKNRTHTQPSTSSNVFRLSNIDAEGKFLKPDASIREINLANQLWHTDNSFTKPRAAVSMLYGCILPPTGGQTGLCDMRVAYETLPEDLRKLVCGLYGYHSVVFSRALKGFTGFSAEERNAMPPIRRPLVYNQPETGRKALNVASHVCDIDGYSREDALELIDTLIAHATVAERVYSHEWKLGDLLIWENRLTMHRATPFEEFKHVRDMRALRTLDLVDA